MLFARSQVQCCQLLLGVLWIVGVITSTWIYMRGMPSVSGYAAVTINDTDELSVQLDHTDTVAHISTSVSHTLPPAHLATNVSLTFHANNPETSSITLGRAQSPVTTSSSYITPNHSGIAVIHVITPTYARPSQRPDVTRLAWTLRNVPALHWIIVEDALRTSTWIELLAEQLDLNVTILHNNAKTENGKGIHQRNEALQWIRDHDISNDDVIYFGDDDNAYDARLFESIRTTRRVSLVPVGGFLDIGVTTPVVVDGRIVKIIGNQMESVPFPVDIGSITVSVGYWKHAGCPMTKPHEKYGYMPSAFLENLKISLENIEPKANNCTKVYVWRTRTQRTVPLLYSFMKKYSIITTQFGNDTNILDIKHQLFLRNRPFATKRGFLNKIVLGE